MQFKHLPRMILLSLLCSPAFAIDSACTKTCTSNCVDYYNACLSQAANIGRLNAINSIKITGSFGQSQPPQIQQVLRQHGFSSQQPIRNNRVNTNQSIHSSTAPQYNSNTTPQQKEQQPLYRPSQSPSQYTIHYN